VAPIFNYSKMYGKGEEDSKYLPSQRLFKRLILLASVCARGTILGSLIVNPLLRKLSSSAVHIAIER